MSTIKRRLIILSWVIALSFTALGAATYAWMSIATSYEVSDLELNVITENAMEIALDNAGVPGEWVKILSSEQIVDADATLRPVTWSAKDRAFYAPTYGLDGRISFLSPHLITSASTDISTPSSAEAEEGEGAGYLISVDLWFRTGASKVTAYLSGPENSEPDKMGGGTYAIGNPIWNSDLICHEDGGRGAQYTIRIGFLTYDYYKKGAENAATEEEKSKYLVEEGRFYIYEPNAEEGVTTLGMDGGALEGDGKLLQQLASTWVEQEPVLHGSVDYTMGEFIGEDTNMFQLVAESPRRVTLFIWIEGFDEQCNNSISAGEILMNLQIAGKLYDTDQGIIRPENGGADE